MSNLLHFADNGIGANDVLTDGQGRQEAVGVNVGVGVAWRGMAWHTFLPRSPVYIISSHGRGREGPSLTVTGHSRGNEEEFCEMLLYISSLESVDCKAFIEPWKCTVERVERCKNNEYDGTVATRPVALAERSRLSLEFPALCYHQTYLSVYL